VLGETALLLFSSITYGFAMLALYKGNKQQVLGWLAMTFLFGAASSAWRSTSSTT
jgi:cytochrome o ubiquinol oxidase subunit 3